jgi:cytochrome c peroxidase
MAVNPVSGKVYVSNSEAQNHVRFEGDGVHASGPSGKLAGPGEPPTVQGNLARARITVLDGANVLPRHLNKHIDYAVRPAPAGVKEKSLSTPVDMVVTPDGATLYVAAFGSGRIGKFSTAELESDSFVPDAADHIPLSGGGPSGLVLAGNRLYTLSRFDMSVKVVDTGLAAEIQSLPLHNPEPADVVAGRPFLYDAALTSSNGEASCASCHVFGDLDDLAWDLGDPDGSVVANGNPFNPAVPTVGDPLPREFHPMKGPMATQSLRGLDHMGPQHWRGDRQGNEVQAFEAFLVAFSGLLGAEPGQISAAQMTQFRKFALALRYPPNPIRKLDNSARPEEADGETLYFAQVTDVVATCNGCHVLSAADGHFGGDGRTIFDGGTEHIKIPHLRNEYQKVGMFGMSQPTSSVVTFTGDFTHQGDQIRGFGFLHDASIDSLARFFGVDRFDLDAAEEDQIEAFMLAFPSDLAPIVGQQVTLAAGNGPVAGPQLDLLVARAEAGFTSLVLGGAVKECDLVAKVLEAGRERGYLYDPASDLFLPDDGGAGIADASLRAKAAGVDQEVTYTCHPPGSGQRLALDRDRDTLWNGVETGTGVFVSPSDTGTDPASADSDGDGFADGVEVNVWQTDPTDPQSYPGSTGVPPPPVPALSPLGTALLFAALALAALPALRRRK